MSDGENRRDMDRTVIRMGGRDFVAWHLIQGAAFGVVGIAAGIYGLAAGVPLVVAVGVVLLAVGVGTAFGR